MQELRSSILRGVLPPGSQIVEAQLAKQFGVSRGPLREAIRQLVDDGLLVTVPYTGTRVVDLSIEDMREIFSIRTELEIFAFRQVWPTRDSGFAHEMHRRHGCLLDAVDAGDDERGIQAEVALHSFVYEASGHRILLGIWNSLRGKLQLYWAAHHLAHGRRGPKRDGHAQYVELAVGDDLEAMIAEIRQHMRRGYVQTEHFLRKRLEGRALLKSNDP